MALPQSSVSVACRSVAEFIRESFRLLGYTVRVLTGTPTEADASTGGTEHRVNLFFNRFEPSVVGPDVLPGQTWFLRAHCLVTAFAVAEETVSAGENDLRLLGEIIRFFHETPIMDAVDDQGEVIRLQIIFQPLGLNDINQLWSTQKEVAYRPSVAYELALVPVVPRTRTIEGPRVGAVAAGVRPRTATGTPPMPRLWTPPVPFLRVDTEREDWAPLVSLVRDGVCVQNLALAVGSSELAAFVPEALVVGELGKVIELRWDVWERTSGWQTVDPHVSVTVGAREADPEHPPLVSRASVALPFKDRAGQAVLYAVRRYRRATDAAGSPEIEVRSNPVLVTLYTEGA